MAKNFVKFINNLLPERIQGNSGKAQWWSWPFDLEEKTNTPEFVQQPEYPEAKGARENWWSTLQKWGSDPNYGAISPDWSNIWDTVQRRVKEYYSGGPLTTGINEKLKANLARRGMSDQPAADYLLMASGADEANKMKDIATEQGIAKANLSESGRTTWLNSLQNLAQQKPSGTWYTPETLGTQLLNLATGVGGAAVNYAASTAGANAQNSWLEKLLKQNQNPQAVVSPYSSSPSWLNTSGWR